MFDLPVGSPVAAAAGLDDGLEVVVVLGFRWTTRLTILCLYSPYLKI